VIGRDGSRDEVITKYRAWIVRQPALMAALHELRDKDLVCWCVRPSAATPTCSSNSRTVEILMTMVLYAGRGAMRHPSLAGCC
jgi:hypothetical protein